MVSKKMEFSMVFPLFRKKPCQKDTEVKSVPDLITKDPSAVKNCDVVLLTVPSSFHEFPGRRKKDFSLGFTNQKPNPEIPSSSDTLGKCYKFLDGKKL